MGHNFHSVLSLCSKEVTFPYIPFQKSDSRVDTDVLMEVAYSYNFLAVSDSSTCPDIGTS